MGELISVVIPAFNREGLIQRCIDNLLKQTYENIEIIVVDDKSSDRTADLVDAYKDPRVRKCVRLEKNRGACFARNAGADCAAGRFIAFQDSDDIWETDKLEKQFKFMAAGGYDMVFCGMKRVDAFDRQEWYFPSYNFNETEDGRKRILYENCISTQCILMTKEAFEKVRFDPSIKRYQDWDFAIRAAMVLKLGYLKETLVVSEVQENSISRMTSEFDALSGIYKKYSALISEDPALDAHFLRQMGDKKYKQRDREAIEFYKKSLERKGKLKVLLKYMMSVVRFGK